MAWIQLQQLGTYMYGTNILTETNDTLDTGDTLVMIVSSLGGGDN